MPARRDGGIGGGGEASRPKSLLFVEALGVYDMPHIVLLGDSVFDNAAYVAGGHDVVMQLRARLPATYRASLLAIDGDLIGDVARQLSNLPSDATHLVVSVGGNDALGCASVLSAPVRTTAEALVLLADVHDRFGVDYAAMLATLTRIGTPVTCCTIYEPRFTDPVERRASATALAILNDCITRLARMWDVSIIDLRDICDNDADFANPIEPSEIGGAKIAAAIARLAS